ncbi:glycosyltransferase [Arenibacter sp. ARW7G5Y1]|uniref:glycosyltransferase n=1 Tax=Arenibacter sp. ARW7G5Y1 TaxID=2135619 RepID=UPI000D76E88E|nr:glycosyltransferase [Arenibacter sp. ARW7G5Y1]PXX25035.1 glycosyltransferase involved in cell wall biosynthesis [Arenibacter sp. ARW7G5Y1]
MENKRKIDLAIVTREPFPFGMAATNRILSYSKVISTDKNVKVYIAKATENKANVQNKLKQGRINNVLFEYASNTTIWPFDSSKIFKIKKLILGYWNLIKSLKNDKPKTIIIYSSDFFLRILILTCFLKSKIIIEENEYPKILKKTNSKLIQKIYLSMYSRCSGVMVMTEELLNYYKRLNPKEIFHLPMTVDIQRFTQDSLYQTKEDYFVYVGGNGGAVRDSITSMLKGFTTFSKKFPQYEFHIVGPIKQDDKILKESIKLLKGNGILHKVIFKGEVNSKNIPLILKKAVGILMTPQRNFDSGGFPTKLGEFLASGVPVITTNVSEISNFLNITNSYIIEPGNIDEISIKMEEIVLNPRNANEIGLKGQEVAKKYFNAESYLKELKLFLEI